MPNKQPIVSIRPSGTERRKEHCPKCHTDIIYDGNLVAMSKKHHKMCVLGTSITRKEGRG